MEAAGSWIGSRGRHSLVTNFQHVENLRSSVAVRSGGCREALEAHSGLKGRTRSAFTLLIILHGTRLNSSLMVAASVTLSRQVRDANDSCHQIPLL
ncbi:hypothetical protein E2C01_046220 [Portunus trituberculatus]|uniref:Uncharacterized protein n=1 Tax=Portunus trituberculatus TaxID=210409 RepID=A0A5B7G0D0_PORTR|nr:hypothetical protein [Portunus trituberculatus]